MLEYFTSSGARPPLEECLHRVDECDVLVVIVAHRYGWIPPGPENKSITRLECLQANHSDPPKEVLAFLIEPTKSDWPFEFRDASALVKAIEEGDSMKTAELQLAVKEIMNFKSWLQKLGIRSTFVSPEDVRGKVYQSLIEWWERHKKLFTTVAPLNDPQIYLEWQLKKSSHIDIKGLQVSAGKANRFGIEELNIPMTTHNIHVKEDVRQKGDSGHEPRRVELHEVLQAALVAIIGDPGAGKTTFLRRIAYNLCQSLLGIEVDAAQKRLQLSIPYFPIFIRLFELAQHISECRLKNHQDCPNSYSDPQWIIHFLAEQSRSLNWKLDKEYFQERLSSDQVILLLDGLDEAPDRLQRELLSELVTNAGTAFRGARFVISCRPQAYSGKVVLQDFSQVNIEPLEADAVQGFLQRWTAAIYYNSPAEAEEHLQQLLEAVRTRGEIRRMARNPVMLTALAVVHWNEKRLPEQRVDLYESIITWLLRAREQKPNRATADVCSVRVQQLALAMQNHPKGRQVQMSRREAAESIQHLFKAKTKQERIVLAENFLAEEEVDSGVLIGRGHDVAFWHLTFLEYLASRALAGQTDEDQQKALLQNKLLFSSEWRETLLLYGGVLYKQGVAKVDTFFKLVLDLAEKDRGLANQARWAGLIGAMLADLRAFKYEFSDSRYHELLDRVLTIFDAKKAAAIPPQDRLQAAEALGQAGDPRLRENNLIIIPAGSFYMGAQKKSGRNQDKGAFPDESPVHKVTLSEFKIGRFLVTVEEYSRFINDDGYKNSGFWQSGGFGEFTEPADWDAQIVYPNRPVVGVSWYEAKAYAAWAKADLPTEAQWERAARGPGDSYHKYSWGDEPPNGENTNSLHNKIGHAVPIGLFASDCTQEGVLDMGGNVREWCRDWKDVKDDKQSEFYRLSDDTNNPLNDEKGQIGKVGNTGWRVVRGGSWGFSDDSAFRCAVRFIDYPDVRHV